MAERKEEVRHVWTEEEIEAVQKAELLEMQLADEIERECESCKGDGTYGCWDCGLIYLGR